MGEIAEAMISGELCCQCGQALYDDVIEQNLGFPIVCEDCFAIMSKKEKEEWKERVETVFHKNQSNINN